MYKNALYLTAKLTALAAVVLYNIPADMLDGGHAVSILAVCCLFLTDFLINKHRAQSTFGLICFAAEVAGCFVFDAGVSFPVLLALIFQLIDKFCAGGYFYTVSAVSALLLGMIIEPSYYSVVIVLMMTVLFIFGKVTAEKLAYCKMVNYTLRRELSAQQERISGLINYTKTLRETTALEERCRFSTRIHDRLGHGISGSIILLEGVKLNLEANPKLAEKNLGIAIENLRGSVDSIREALREERPAQSAAGIADFKEMLERFSIAYGIKTDFSVEGDTEKILPHIWNCLKENLTEAMTNTVKHSNADKFAFHIYIYNKIIRAEFSDNGTTSGVFSKGMGLDAMEERTAVCAGTCSFSKELSGFKIINIFRL